MSSVVFALLAVLFSAVHSITSRSLMRRKLSPEALLIICTGLGSVALIPFIDFDALLVPEPLLGLILISCFIWNLADYYSEKAHQHLSATACSILGSLTLVVVTAAGVMLFDETLGWVGICGVAIILLGIFVQSTNVEFRWSGIGVKLKLLAVVTASAAVVLDKYLTEELAPEVILFYGFFACHVLYLCMFYRHLPSVTKLLRTAPCTVACNAACWVLSYHFFLLALAVGSLTVTYTILETTVVAIFILEVLFLQLRDGLLRRGLASGLCCLGAILVCM